MSSGRDLPEDPWNTVFGKEAPPGFRYEEADAWSKDTWDALLRVDVVVARRVSVLVEVSRRNMALVGVKVPPTGPFCDDLRKMSLVALYSELADVQESVLRLKELLAKKEQSQC